MADGTASVALLESNRTSELLAHLPEPDYTRPLLSISPAQRQRIVDLLGLMYGPAEADRIFPELERRMRVYYAHKPQALIDADSTFTPAERFSERDVVLITYGDLLTTPGRPPLQVLASFLRRFMHGAINTVHILPFFPYSSDRGFSIV